MTKDHLNLSTDNAQDSLFSIDDCNEAYQYLQNSANFVSFHTGLTTLMQRCGYTGSSEDVEEKTAYLLQKLAAIHVKITEITVRDWFSGKRRPSLDSRSRKLVYEICFALGASFELVQEFFRQVYFSRSFNCHTIKEAVYYYCLHQNHSYDHALELYETIKAMPETAKFEASDPVYTDQIRNALDNCRSDEEFLAYFPEINLSLTAGTREHSFISKNLSFRSGEQTKISSESKSSRKSARFRTQKHWPRLRLPG